MSKSLTERQIKFKIYWVRRYGSGGRIGISKTILGKKIKVEIVTAPDEPTDGSRISLKESLKKEYLVTSSGNGAYANLPIILIGARIKIKEIIGED